MSPLLQSEQTVEVLQVTQYCSCCLWFSGIPTTQGSGDNSHKQRGEKGGVEQFLYFHLLAPGQFLYCTPLGRKE